MDDPAAQAAELALGAVDALPAGELERRLAGPDPLRVKLGIDPTAPDIHLGHVVVLEKLRQFQQRGHTVVLIIGDYTARVGDPSGRSGERPVLTTEQIEANARTFQEQAFKVLDAERTEVRFNGEWLEMPSGELFDIARRFTVARLLERDDFERRIEASQPISVLELLYPVLQGYDSVAVRADVELGGTDQRFNLLFARDVQEAFGQRPQVIVTMPILPGTDGKRRMSKSLGNYIGVDEPPAEMFGKLMSVPDEALGRYWELLGGRSLDSEAHPAAAKRELGRLLVDRFCGEGAGAEAEQRFDRVHVEREAPEDIEAADPAAYAAPGEDGEPGPVHLPALIAGEFGVSRAEARRLIDSGGVRLDGEQLPPRSYDLELDRLAGAVLRVGRRRFRKLDA